MNQDFSALLFGKPWEEIGLPDIEAFFKREQTESDKLEFKSIPTNYSGQKEDDRKILKSICGFLNAEGGVLVWGAPEENKMNPDPVQKYGGTLTPTSVFHEKDAFIAKVANRIVPSPKGIRFKAIPVDNKFIYIIDVPQSQFPPHQFEDIYYMRMDGQTKAAPHHYIEALFRRVAFPRLEAYLRIDDYLPENSDLFSIQCTVLFMNFSRYQNDENLHCRIISDQGRIMTLHGSPSPLDTGIETGSDYIPGIITQMIYYGNFVHHTFKLSLSRKRLAETGHQCDIRLHFGARYSPMKLSFYKLQIASTLVKGRKNDIIVEKQENLFFHENEEDQGWTEQTLIEQNLNS
jgi:hypothetical protein